MLGFRADGPGIRSLTSRYTHAKLLVPKVSAFLWLRVSSPALQPALRAVMLLQLMWEPTPGEVRSLLQQGCSGAHHWAGHVFLKSRGATGRNIHEHSPTPSVRKVS